MKNKKQNFKAPKKLQPSFAMMGIEFHPSHKLHFPSPSRYLPKSQGPMYTLQAARGSS